MHKILSLNSRAHGGVVTTGLRHHSDDHTSKRQDAYVKHDMRRGEDAQDITLICAEGANSQHARRDYLFELKMCPGRAASASAAYRTHFAIADSNESSRELHMDTADMRACAADGCERTLHESLPTMTRHRFIKRR